MLPFDSILSKTKGKLVTKTKGKKFPLALAAIFLDVFAETWLMENLPYEQNPATTKLRQVRHKMEYLNMYVMGGELVLGSHGNHKGRIDPYVVLGDESLCEQLQQDITKAFELCVGQVYGIKLHAPYMILDEDALDKMHLFQVFNFVHHPNFKHFNPATGELVFNTRKLAP